MHAQRRTDLQITESEMAHHIAMMARTHEVRRRLRAFAREPQPMGNPIIAEPRCQTPEPAQIKLDPTRCYAFPIGPVFVPKYLRGEFNPNKPRLLPKEIIAGCARLAGVTPADLVGKCRKPEMSRPRQFAMWKLRKETGRSYPQIGRDFGGRDHSTCLHAFRRVEASIAQGTCDPANPRPWFALGYGDEERRSPK